MDLQEAILNEWQATASTRRQAPPAGYAVGDIARRVPYVFADELFDSIAGRFPSDSPVVVVVDDAHHPQGVVRLPELFELAANRHGAAPTSVEPRHIMSPVETVALDTPVAAAVARCVELQLDHLVAVTGSGTLAGVVTATDLLVAREADRTSGVVAVPTPALDSPADEAQLSSIAAPAVTVREHEPASVLVSKYAQYQPSVVVVVDDHDKPCGYVTPTQVMAAAAGHGRNSLQPLTVADIMARGFVALDGAVSVAEAAQRVVDESQAWIAVCEHGELVGVVYSKQLLHLLWQPLVERVRHAVRAG